MDKNTLLFVVIAALAGFIGGFMLANSLNRSEMASIRNQSVQTSAPDAKDTGPNTVDLSPTEVRAKIAEADKNPGNFEFQKGLGTGLYQYAAMKNDQGLLNESQRILERANSLNGRDFDVLVALGNTRFDIAFAKKDSTGFQAARELYLKALEIKPADPNVTTDLGLTYFLQDPPAFDKAETELRKVSDTNPKHDRSLQFLVQVYIKQNRLTEAAKSLEKLRNINSKNEAIADLTTQLSTAQNGVK